MSKTALNAMAAAGLLLAGISSASGQYTYDGCSLYHCYVFPGELFPAAPVPATSVAIGNPTGIAVDTLGSIYIAGSSIVFKVDPSGWISRIAGNGHNGYSGDGGPATDALLSFPLASANDPIDFWDVVGGLALDSSGNVYIADFFNNRVRKVDADGVISTVAGQDFGNPFDWPGGVSVDLNGNLYVTSSTVFQVTPGGNTPLVANNCGRPNTPGVCVPYGVATDSSGTLYVADAGMVYKIGVDGNLTVVAGCISSLSACSDGLGDGGPATAAILSGPYGIALDAVGNLYITDTYKNRIRKVSPDGIITTVAGRGPSSSYYYQGGYSGDGGAATDAQLNLPHGVAVDSAGNIYIADTMNCVVRKVTPDGIISTVAGNGNWSYSTPIGVALQQAVTAMKTAGGTDSLNFWQWAWCWQYLPAFSGAPPGFGVAGSISPDVMEQIITAGGGDALRNISAEQWVEYFRQVAPQ